VTAHNGHVANLNRGWGKEKKNVCEPMMERKNSRFRFNDAKGKEDDPFQRRGTIGGRQKKGGGEKRGRKISQYPQTMASANRYRGPERANAVNHTRRIQTFFKQFRGKERRGSSHKSVLLLPFSAKTKGSSRGAKLNQERRGGEKYDASPSYKTSGKEKGGCRTGDGEKTIKQYERSGERANLIVTTKGKNKANR